MIEKEALKKVDIETLVYEIKGLETKQRERKLRHRSCQRIISRMHPDEVKEALKHDFPTYSDAIFFYGSEADYLTTLYSLRAHLRGRLHMKTYKGKEWNIELQESLIENTAGRFIPYKESSQAEVLDSRVQKTKTKSLVRRLFETIFS